MQPGHPNDDGPGRTWPPFRYVAIAGLTLLGVWLAISTAWAAKDILFVTFLGILIASILRYPIDALARFMPRSLAAVITLAGVLGALIGLVVLAVPLVTEQASLLAQQAPEVIDRIQAWWTRQTRSAPLTELADGDLERSLRHRIVAELDTLAGQAVPVAIGTIGGIAGVVVITVLAVFLAHDPHAYLAGLLRLVPERHERTAAEALRRLGRTISRWMVGTLIAMAAVGVLTSVGLLIVGIDSWLVLGLLAFFGEFVPYVGPIVSAVPGVAIGFADSPMTGLYTLLVYVGVQQVESNLITPLIMRQAVRLQPAVLLVWQLILGAAFGVTGILIATPLLACIQVLVDYLYAERTLHKTARPP